MTKATTVNEIKLRQLDEALCACCSVPTAHAAWNKELAIAFSGGLDSRFLAFAARMFGYSVDVYKRQPAEDAETSSASRVFHAWQEGHCPRHCGVNAPH